MSNPESKISELLRTSLEKIREAVDANTVVGEPVWNDEEVAVLPVSKVSVGTASGGLDRFAKNVAGAQKEGAPPPKGDSFGGGGGIGVTVNPIGFLVIKTGGSVEFLSIAAAGSSSTAVNVLDTVAEFLDRSPELLAKVKNIFKGDKSSTDEPPATDAPESESSSPAKEKKPLKKKE